MLPWRHNLPQNSNCTTSGPPRWIWTRQGPILYPKNSEWLFLIRAYWNPKSRQGSNLACFTCLACLTYRGGPEYSFEFLSYLGYIILPMAPNQMPSIGPRTFWRLTKWHINNSIKSASVKLTISLLEGVRSLLVLKKK